MKNNIKNPLDVPVNLDQLACYCSPLQLSNACYESLATKNTAAIPYARYQSKLKEFGVLIISLAYADEGQTLQRIAENIGIPHKHNDSESFVWDIKVAAESPTSDYLARSHQSHEFYLHTDCSYEEKVPDYFGLYVLNPDQFNGGKNLIVDQQDLIPCLSKENLSLLQNHPVTIRVPQEFYKGISSITAPIIDKDLNLRYRREIIDLEKLTPAQKIAIHEFESLAYSVQHARHLSLAKNQILLLHNKRYLHGRTLIKNKKRHLKRIRFFEKS
ncbi:putative taurine catabolism dioxygenase TauD [Candidatus Rickettsiella viridis]|uniref:Putative taurine catabolism dioxygenase TauD n=1 Tax=Candidatus Rickettsiella viridis TaxID=676208 RepID=A0A2Z5UWI4_9COXI|nr:TauD/TfdA family dioxygenase [Candidatus Rickettsiella viridis]BBB15353.1 putative taurine catabolism dioxygenase TauD [Candidatus Rickettsiella viridis]